MNGSFPQTSPLLRSILAAAAVLTMLAIAGGIDGLIAHYDAELQFSGAKLSRLAQR